MSLKCKVVIRKDRTIVTDVMDGDRRVCSETFKLPPAPSDHDTGQRMKERAMIKLDDHDAALVDTVVSAFRNAVGSAHSRSAVVKRIVAIAVRERNRGRAAAIRRHPFKGICEASGRPLDERDKALDEVEPKKGYDGKVRWVCHKGNNSGLRSCGGC